MLTAYFFNLTTHLVNVSCKVILLCLSHVVVPTNQIWELEFSSKTKLGASVCQGICLIKVFALYTDFSTLCFMLGFMPFSVALHL